MTSEAERTTLFRLMDKVSASTRHAGMLAIIDALRPRLQAEAFGTKAKAAKPGKAAPQCPVCEARRVAKQASMKRWRESKAAEKAPKRKTKRAA